MKRINFRDKRVYRRFWINQYKARNADASATDLRHLINSTQLMLYVSTNTEDNPAWMHSRIILGDTTKHCTMIGSDDMSVTMKINRNADEKIVSAMFRMYKFLDFEGGRNIGLESIPELFSAMEAIEQRAMDLDTSAVSKPQWVSRVIGLWLWDYVQEHGGKQKRGIIAQSIRAVRALLESVGGDFAYYATSDESGTRVLRNLFGKTEQCIQGGKVLALT